MIKSFIIALVALFAFSTLAFAAPSREHKSKAPVYKILKVAGKVVKAPFGHHRHHQAVVKHHRHHRCHKFAMRHHRGHQRHFRGHCGHSRHFHHRMVRR